MGRFFAGFVSQILMEKRKRGSDMKEVVLNVEGMSCKHCISAITEGLMERNGVLQVEVSLEKATVRVGFLEDEISEDTMKKTIEELGYVVK
jgi:copper ion binding protein